MPDLSLRRARTVIAKIRAAGREMDLQPLSVVVLDAGGNIKAFEREDGASNLRFNVAYAKAYGAIGFGVGTRALMNRAEAQPYFTPALGMAFGGNLIPVPGGLLLKDPRGAVIGAVGVTGDSSDNDEAAALTGIEAAGLVGDGG